MNAKTVITKVPSVELSFSGHARDWKLFKSMYEVVVEYPSIVHTCCVNPFITISY